VLLARRKSFSDAYFSNITEQSRYLNTVFAGTLLLQHTISQLSFKK